MSWRAQSRSKDAKTPSGSRDRSEKPELDRCPVQPYQVCKAAKVAVIIGQCTGAGWQGLP
jgi:hypothetical protein